MTDETLPPPVWVDGRQSLQHMLGDLNAQDAIAVDTESNSLHAYRERVCLMQFSTPQTDYLVDPFTIRDLSELGPLFANPAIQKIFHASEYDLICLKRDFGFECVNLFDTMQAARILGYQYVGLDNILFETFEIKIDKRYQKADWGKRPLTPEQIDYARQDTHYLFRLRALLESQLREADRWELAQDDFALACKVDVQKERGRGSSMRRFSTRKDVSPRELTILQELCQARDQIAERLDRPTFKVITDDMLLAIARNLPEDRAALAELGLSTKQVRLWADMLLAAVKRGEDAPLLEKQVVHRPSDTVLRRLDKLKAWRKELAQKLEVESDIVLPKRYLAPLAENPPHTLAELETVMTDSPWRLKNYGTQILSLVGG